MIERGLLHDNMIEPPAHLLGDRLGDVPRDAWVLGEIDVDQEWVTRRPRHGFDVFVAEQVASQREVGEPPEATLAQQLEPSLGELRDLRDWRVEFQLAFRKVQLCDFAQEIRVIQQEVEAGGGVFGREGPGERGQCPG